VNGSYVRHRFLLNGAAGDQVLSPDEGIYEEKCQRKIYSSQNEGLREDEATGFKEMYVGRIESSLLNTV
jgi:hypothetical protein